MTWIILNVSIGLCALLTGSLSLSLLLKHLSKCSKKRLAENVEEEIAQMRAWQREIEMEWENAYDKLRSIMGRADRAKRTKKEEAIAGPETPEEYKAQIMNLARQRGIIR